MLPVLHHQIHSDHEDVSPRIPLLSDVTSHSQADAVCSCVQSIDLLSLRFKIRCTKMGQPKWTSCQSENKGRIPVAKTLTCR